MVKTALNYMLFFIVCTTHAELIDIPTFTTDTPQAAKVLQTVDAWIQKKNWDEALIAIKQGLFDFPEQPDLLARAGHVYTMKKEFALAENYWARLVEKYPDNAWAHACRGGLLLRLNRIDEAEQELLQSLKLDSSLLVARYHLACVLLKKNDPDHAKRALQSLSVYEIGHLVTWMRDENKILISLLGENGYRVLCAIVADRNGDTTFPEAPALKLWTDRVATLLWKSYQAEQQQMWDIVIESLEMAKHEGVSAPAIQIKIDECKAKLNK